MIKTILKYTVLAISMITICSFVYLVLQDSVVEYNQMIMNIGGI